MKIGDWITLGAEDKWLVTSIFNHKDYFRYELVNIKTACFAEIKIEKTPRVTK